MGSSVDKERIKIEKGSDCYLQDGQLKVLNPYQRMFESAYLYTFDFHDDIKEECLNVLSGLENELEADLIIYVRDKTIFKIEYMDNIIESKL